MRRALLVQIRFGVDGSTWRPLTGCKCLTVTLRAFKTRSGPPWEKSAANATVVLATSDDWSGLACVVG